MTELKFKRMIMSMLVLLGMLLMLGLAGMTQVNLTSKAKNKAAIRANEYGRQVVEESVKFVKMKNIKYHEAKPLLTIK